MGFEILQPVHPANNIISAHLQEALIVAQPEDPIKHLCESINVRWSDELLHLAKGEMARALSPTRRLR